MKQFIWISILVLLIASLGIAQELKVSDGSSSGTYQQMLRELKGICPNVSITEVPASGAVENLDNLVSNQANVAFMHTDVLMYRAQKEEGGLQNLKTLIALFPEDVHFVALNKPFPMGMFSKNRVLNSIDDLYDLPVGAAGGGWITINLVRLQSEIPYKCIQYDKGDQVLAALNSGEIACAVFVGAAPLPNLKDLGHDYKLLPVNDGTLSRLKSVYKRSVITYTKMSTASIPTISADCLIVTRVYHTPKFVDALRTFRKAFYDGLDELKETAGTHKAWQKVDPENHGKWEWYDLRDVAPAPVKTGRTRR